ncbi:hypothetical protein DFP93_101148 [Aneurinibacillus soli]|uniref:Uncharacterized protein n=1 Tax=Aneurinibacillus soli TaxID=1500254 RepID=A0A0U4WHB9_9BACL|nr:hypothetical protein [Aneurinibacillus soli]PYE64123.1 hypothetical protein DFP93_101148 [Aneurinibacillus soli]BAU28072.1 hypothetical protein CB4_02246 [Aneurinibacillus soli]
MKYDIHQTVKIVDFNNELLSETDFYHGEFDLPVVTPSCVITTHALGLKEFTVVYDLRQNEKVQFRVIEVSMDLTQPDRPASVYLEAVTLIIGQHDVGQV